MENEDFNMDGSQSDDFLSELLSRFEQMMNNHQPSFFDVDELLELVDYYIVSQQLPFARRALDIAMSQYPDNKDVLIYQCRYYHASGRSLKAVEMLHEILKNGEENVEALISLGEILSDMGKYAEAVDYLESALKLVDDEEKQFVIQQIVDALDDAGQHHKMIPYLKELIIINPGNSEAMSGIAYCFNILNREEEGVAYFSKIADADPYNTYAWFNLGTLYFGIGLYEKAIDAFGYVLAIEPKFTTAAIKMGSALSALERHDSAIDVYNSVLEYEKKDASIYCYLAYCYSQKKDFQSAIHNFHKSLVLDAEMTESHLGLVYAYAGLDQFDIAYRHILLVLLDYDDVSDLWFYKAYLEEQLDNYQGAIDSFRKGLAISPTDVNAWLSLAGMLTDYLNDHYGALDMIDEALKTNINNPELLYRSAAICFEASFKNEGIVRLHRALTIDKTKSELIFLYNPLLENNSTILEILNQYL